MLRQNCNRCNPTGRCHGANNKVEMLNCKNFRPPHAGWKFAELALAHPTSLNECLSALPLNTNVSFYIKERA